MLEPEFGKLFANMKRSTPSRLIVGNQKENGYAWELRDASLARNLATDVDMQKPNMTLGWDIVAIKGESKACRVRLMV